MSRKPIHTRRTEYASYRRDDGLFEIEGKLIDTAATSGRSFHVMGLQMAFDDQLVIRSINEILETVPFEDCRQGPDVYARLIGEKIAPGWKKRVGAIINRHESCTHQLELLFNMGTVAYLAVSMAPLLDGIDPLTQSRDAGARPFFLGGCKAWRLDGPIVADKFPKFAEPKND